MGLCRRSQADRLSLGGPEHGGAPYPALYPSLEGCAGQAGSQSWGPVGPSTEAGVAESARAAAVPWLRVMTRCASVARGLSRWKGATAKGHSLTHVKHRGVTATLLLEQLAGDVLMLYSHASCQRIRPPDRHSCREQAALPAAVPPAAAAAQRALAQTGARELRRRAAVSRRAAWQQNDCAKAMRSSYRSEQVPRGLGGAAAACTERLLGSAASIVTSGTPLAQSRGGHGITAPCSAQGMHECDPPACRSARGGPTQRQRRRACALREVAGADQGGRVESSMPGHGRPQRP